MLNVRVAFLILAMMFANAWSSEPVKPDANTRTQQAQPEQRGTEKAPLFIKGEVTTEKNKEETNNEAEERKIKAEVDSALVKYTGLLALFTFLLFCFTAALWWVTYCLSRDAKTTSDRQAGEMQRSLAAAENAADTAKKSIDAYQLSERAWMAQTRPVVVEFKNATYVDTGETGVDGIMFSLEWVNSGRTPAIRCNVSIASMTTSPNDPIPTFATSGNVGQNQAPLLPGVRVKSLDRHFRDSEIEALKNGTARIFLYSRVGYETVFPGDGFKHTEVCIEVGHDGFVTGTQKINFTFSAVGLQNSAS